MNKVNELQAEAERVTYIIQPVHQKVRQAAESAELTTSEHISSDLVENLQKVEEEVR